MEPDWKLIGENITNYIDNETFLSARKPPDICNILDNAKLSPHEFITLFTNLSKYHGKSDMLVMLGHARKSELATQAEVDKISSTISSILGINILDKVFSFTQNKTRQQNSNSQIQDEDKFINIYVNSFIGVYCPFENINLNTTIKDFKLKLQKESGIPANKQLLYLGNFLLPNSGTLEKYLSPIKKDNVGARLCLHDGIAISFNKIQVPIDIDDFNITVEKLKEKFYSKTGWPIKYQTMTYNGIIMDDNRTLNYYKIQRGSVNEVRIQYDISDLKGGQCIYIRLITVKTLVLYADIWNSTVFDLKLLICDSEGIFPRDQDLYYGGERHLEDNFKLIDYDIQRDSTIYLSRVMRGGKPVIYLYPKEEIDAKVSIKINNGEFSFVYPSFDEENTWNVKALPSGEIIHRGKKLRYLFWETLFYPILNMDKGFIIKGEESVSFFEDKLNSMNLNDTEICDFITYWCPKLCGYKYIKVCFQFENFDEMCPMNVEPKPDNINRVFFAALPLENTCDIEPQELPAFKRDGFTVIEWGGTIVTSEKY